MNNQPERSVEEIVGEFLEEFSDAIQDIEWVDENRHAEDGNPFVATTMKSWLTQTLKAERQKREEVVEALRDIASVTPDDAERWGWYETVNKIVGRASETLTKPNNK